MVLRLKHLKMRYEYAKINKLEYFEDSSNASDDYTRNRIRHHVIPILKNENSNLVKAKGVWKAVLYSPALTSVVISGTLFRLMFSEYGTGQMNVLLQLKVLLNLDLSKVMLLL